MGLLTKIISLGIVISSLYPQLKSLRFKKEISKDSEGPLEEPSERALLKEYEVCQSHNNSLGQQAWVSISILITVNLLLLGQVISDLTPKSIPIKINTDFIFLILISLSMIFILWIFKRWNKRITFLAWVNNQRMQEIESRYKYLIRKTWRIRGLDLKYDNDKKQQAKWNRLDPSLQAIINRLSAIFPKSKKGNVEEQAEYSPPSTQGFPIFNYIFPTLITLWVLVIAASLFWVGISVCNTLVGIVVAVVVLVAYAAVLVFHKNRSKA